MNLGRGTSRIARDVKRRTGRVLVQSLALALVVPLGVAQLAQAAESPGLGRSDVPASRVSKVKEFAGLGAAKARQQVARDKKANKAQADQARTQQKAVWPGRGEATLGLSQGKAVGAKPAGVPVTFAPLSAGKAAAGGKTRLTMLDQKAARAAGVTGVLLTADADSAGDAKVSVDYSGFASAVGGGWSQRLRLVQLPACALTTPEKPECRKQRPLVSDNDLERQSVSANVSLAEAGRGPATQLMKTGVAAAPAATVLAVTAAAPGSGASPKGSGNYAATPLSASSSWESGGSSGSFTWSYDFTLPPAAAGPQPPLSLSYDSGSVDGRTATSNNQGTSVGEGFGITESYIERSYGSCDDDGHDDVFDSCWKYDNARIVLNGKSSRLVKDDHDGLWRLENDDASKVTRSTGADNGDDNGEYWTVVTGDGTKYVFGQNKLEGADDAQRTNSVSTVPVFGDDSGEPGYSGGDAFADRALDQAWRWNLDYVEDTRGNAATYWYAKETNYYKKNKSKTANADYTRGGYLSRIEYGLRKGALFTDKPDAKVTFSYAERCTAADCSSLTKDTSENWPDVPFDAICSKDDDDCDAAGPSFFSRKRLTGIDTFSYNATTTAYDAVDSWDLTEEYLDGGDIGDSSDQVLTLQSLRRTAKAGDPAITLAPVTFTYHMRPNRVDATDNILPLTRPRINTVTSETGAITTVTLSGEECVRSQVLNAAPDTNMRSCYPQFWHINGAENASIDWFHKYRVLAVTVSDPTAANETVEHAYSYSGAAWHYNDDPMTKKDERTWSEWRGYTQVTAWTGATDVTRSKTVSLYLQGMHGDEKSDGTTKSVSVAPLPAPALGAASVSDRAEYAGQLREQVTYDGSTAIAATVNDPWSQETARQTTPGAGDYVARYVRTQKVHSYTYLTTSQTWRERLTSTSFDSYGMPVTVEDAGDVGKASDETCTRNWYARNADLGITSAVSRTRAVARTCATADSSLVLPASMDPAKPKRGDVIADVGTVYDTATVTAWSASQKPTQGLPTWTGRATGYAATADANGDRLPSAWQKISATTYDTLGRPLSVSDATTNSPTLLAYIPVDAGPLTRTTTTDPKTYKTVSFLDPRRGQPLRVYDVNIKKTEVSYDALGRTTQVWLPNRASGSQAPNQKFAYHLDNTKASWVSSSSLKNDGETYNTTYALYDALLRPLQSQSPTPNGGRLLTDTRYDTRGLAYETHADIFDNTSTPNGTYTRAENGEAPTQAETVFDGAGRATSTSLYIFGVKKWTTATSYTGDSVATTALEGGSAHRTITDVRGQTIETREYASTSPGDASFGSTVGASYTRTKLTYGLDGQQETITGPDDAAWSYVYDLFGRQVTAVDPDKGSTTTEYDVLDRPVKSTDSRGKSVLTAYDELGRPTGTWENSKTDATQLTAFAYDTPLKGEPTSSTRYVGGKSGAAYTQTVTAYDNLNRATATQLQLPASDPFVKAGAPSTLALETYYNINGTLKMTKEPALGGLPSEYVDYDYDPLGHVKSIGGVTGYLLNVDYSALAQPMQLELGTGGTDSKSFFVANTFEEGTGRLRNSHVTDKTHGYMLQDLNYSYDETGNVTAISDPTLLGGASSADTQCFAYDGHQRLTEAWTPASQKCSDARSASSLSGPAPYWTSYTYNQAGQRAGETVHNSTGDTKTTYCYANTAQPHTLTGTTTKPTCTAQERTYDKSGNTLSRPGKSGAQTLVWSAEGQLSKLTEKDASTDYVYSPDGTLLIRNTQNGERVLYAGATELHLRANGTMWAQRYYAAGDVTAAVRTNQSGTNKLSYLTGDRHNTSSLALNPDANQTFTKRYTTPFGSDRGAPLYGPWPDDKGFLGKTRDATTGLTHIGAREYDPSIGQFLSVDPVLSLDQHQSLNGYAYANNNPVTYSDPDGRKIFPDDNGGGYIDSGGKGGTHTAKNRDNARKRNGGGPTELPATSGTASGGSSGSQRPVVNGVVIPTRDELFYRGYGVGGPDADGYAHMLARWADHKCGIRDGIEAFCDTAARAGLIRDPHSSANDPWGIKANIHCFTGRGDCGEALVSDVITVAGLAFGSISRALMARGASSAVAVEAETAAANLFKIACSFSPDTPVLLKDGKTKAISKVKPGDDVEAAEPSTGKHKGARSVIARLVHHDYDLVDVTIRTADGRTSTIHTTAKHPFWNDTLHTWTDAAHLQPGHLLNTVTDSHVQVVAVNDQVGSADMYNLTVDDLHTYYVLAGATPVLVHNDDGSSMVGANGTQLTSSTVWRGPSGMRIDVENPDPGGRPGQMHLQVQVNGMKSSDAPKYQYNFDTGEFDGLPKSLRKELAKTDFTKGVKKGLGFLGQAC
ncbi:RHS repeat-associated core domain-containing protein [Streptomyces sp. AK04-3B]|uniref:RHS repeat-associated core domain-containing protein n=1 Tax=Streptomyces sp. AK04-3B TaxID=3028650 RepID=UPI0029AFBC29|nr:RHS repeat-associated core domain-containing protein [Streptomyces sp. AK04-3B]MDX3800617.1 polymorphic toxin-type HINT domain-containing protein [Streptomyces sp. AK04-3B]